MESQSVPGFLRRLSGLFNKPGEAEEREMHSFPELQVLSPKVSTFERRNNHVAAVAEVESRVPRMHGEDVIDFAPSPLRRRRDSKGDDTAGIGNVFDAKLRMLQNNNRSLAKALSEKKMEASHLYNEIIALRGELQEANEKLLRVPYNNSNIENVLAELEKQIKDCYKSIDKDISMGLQSIVGAVEKITKFKQMIGNTLSILQVPSHSPVNSFSRMSGSRTPLGNSGGGPTRQRAVLPMVSGHVLQPVMVPLAKLKIRAGDRRNNCIPDNGENDIDMTTIVEQTIVENGDVGEEQLFQDNEELPSWSSTESPPDDTVPRPQSQPENTESPATLQATTGHRRQGISKRGSGRGRGRRKESRISKVLPSSTSTTVAKKDEVLTPPEEDDPLEGPSWLLDIANFQGTLRGRYRSRRRFLNRQNASVKVSKTPGVKINESPTRNLPNQAEANVCVSDKLSPRKEAPSTAASPTDTLTQSFNLSCLDSPSSMQSRLEQLEVQGGRKSKRFLRNKLSSNSKPEYQPATLDDRSHEGEQLLKGSPRKVLHESPDSSTNIGEGLMPGNKERSCKTSPVLSSGTPEARTDINQTCQIITNMDITQPVSNLIIQQSGKLKDDTEWLKDEPKPQPRKRFFKTKEEEPVDEIPKVVERTPFDLSMLNETVGNLPPFSSLRSTEKENLQPLSCGRSNDPVILCDVSVVLQDIKDTPKTTFRAKEKGSQSPQCKSSASPKRSRRVRRVLPYSGNYDEREYELSTPILHASQKRKKKGKSQSLTPSGTLTNSASDKHKRRNQSAEKVTSPSILSPKTENTENLTYCYVRIQRSDILESLSKTDKENSPDLLDGHDGMLDLQQQHSENQEGKSTQVTPTSKTSEISAEECCSSPGSTKKDATHIEENEEIDDGGTTDEPIIILDNHDKIQEEEKCSHEVQINETEDRQEYEDREISKAVNPADLDRDAGCQEAMERADSSSPEIINELEGMTAVKNSPGVRASSEAAEEILVTDHPRRRRAASKIMTFKEVSLHSKMRRGENGSVCISTPARGRKKGRGTVRNRSRNKGSIALDDVS